MAPESSPPFRRGRPVRLRARGGRIASENGPGHPDGDAAFALPHLPHDL